MLAYAGLRKVAIPGCGPGSGCDAAASSKWGSIPGLGWPVSYIATAYFLAVLAGWLQARGRVARGEVALWLVRVGAAASAGFLGLAMNEGLWCVYCLVANGSNLLFWVIAERAARQGASGPARRQTLQAGLIVFALGSGLLFVLDSGVGAAARTKAEQERAESAAKIKAASNTTPHPPTPPTPPTGATPTAASTPSATPGPSAAAPPVATNPTTAALTGRWRRGPEQAAVRIVVFTGYQCPDCKRIDAELHTLLASEVGARVSVSMRHYPMCSDCNPEVKTNMHPNGCWAARAAEAAGTLGGPDGFKRMHEWLFARGGAFTDSELPPALQAMGFEPRGFTSLMQSPLMLARVEEDVRLGNDLGLYFSPLIYVNGVEFRGWRNPQALTRTVQEVLATNPAPNDGANDRPPAAIEKYVGDWKAEPVKQIARLDRPGVLGALDAPVRIVVWGDLQEPGTCEADAALRALAASRADVRYEYRHFVMNRACNQGAPRDLFPQGCLAAKAVETAGFLHGPGGYWKAQEWLVNNRDRLTEQTLRDGLPALGIDETEFFASIELAALTDRIRADGQAGRAMNFPSIPAIYVNGRLLPRWKLAGRSILAEVVEAAKVGGPGGK